VNAWQTNFGAGVFQGPSFVRDTMRDQRNGDPNQITIESTNNGKTFYVLGLNPAPFIDASQLQGILDFDANTLPVNLDGLQGQLEDDVQFKTAKAGP
jgi:hypothetical protein